MARYNLNQQLLLHPSWALISQYIQAAEFQTELHPLLHAGNNLQSTSLLLMGPAKTSCQFTALHSCVLKSCRDLPNPPQTSNVTQDKSSQVHQQIVQWLKLSPPFWKVSICLQVHRLLELRWNYDVQIWRKFLPFCTLFCHNNTSFVRRTLFNICSIFLSVSWSLFFLTFKV